MVSTYTPCPLCRQPVDPDASDTVYAIEQRNIGGGFSASGADEIIDGKAGFFHPGCPPERIGWHRRPRPEAA